MDNKTNEKDNLTTLDNSLSLNADNIEKDSIIKNLDTTLLENNNSASIEKAASTEKLTVSIPLSLPKKERELGLDVIRFVAIILVLLIHSFESVFSYNINGIVKLNMANEIISIVVFCLGRISVPLFLLLTGFLLLDRKYNSKNLFSFYKKHLFPLIIAYEIFIFIFFIFATLVEKRTFSYIYVLKTILFLDYVDAMHLWYMPIIIGLYIALPFVSVVLKKFDVFHTLPILALLYLVYYLLPFAQDLLTNQYGLVLPTLNLIQTVDLAFLGGGYGFYLLLGYYLKVSKTRIFNNLVRLIAFIIIFALTVSEQLASLHLNEEGMIWYNYYTLPILSVLLFNFICELCKNKKSNAVLTHLSELTFGIYLYHFIFIRIFLKIIKFPLGFLQKSILMFLFTIITSILFVFLVNKIPKVGKVLFVTDSNIKKLKNNKKLNG